MDPDEIKNSSAKSKPLPAGKLYHVFFSYSSEDAEWVEGIVEKLESSEYGYKCCFADRDFRLGKEVLENITTAIHTSVRTVLVLSPAYLKSNWCTYEAGITTSLDIETRKRILIPILLKECNIPNFIGRLSYISAKNKHFWDRLIDAIDRSNSEHSLPDNEDLLMAISSIALHTCRENGHFLMEKVISDTSRGNLIEESEHLSPELASQVSQQEYDAVMKILLKDFYIRFNGFLAVKCFIAVIFLLCTIPLDTIIMTTFPDKDEQTIALAAVDAGFVGIIVICLSSGFLIRYRSARKATLKQINKAIVHKNILVGLCNKRGYRCCCTKELKIKFFYYDWKPCQLYLENFLESNEGNCSVERMKRKYRRIEDSESAPLITENIAQEILLYFSMEYGELLASRKLIQGGDKRHTDQGECLCQFAESFFNETSKHSYRFFMIFGGPSRQPWRRLFIHDS